MATYSEYFNDKLGIYNPSQKTNCFFHEIQELYVFVKDDIQIDTTTEAQFDLIKKLSDNDQCSEILRRDIFYDYITTNDADIIIKYLRKKQSIKMKLLKD